MIGMGMLKLIMLSKLMLGGYRLKFDGYICTGFRFMVHSYLLGVSFGLVRAGSLNRLVACLV